jgi:hypothetical protein
MNYFVEFAFSLVKSVTVNTSVTNIKNLKLPDYIRKSQITEAKG